MIKKLSISIALAITLTAATTALAQRQPVGGGQRQPGAGGGKQRPNRTPNIFLPGGKANNRPQIGLPGNARPRLGPNQKRQIQQRVMQEIGLTSEQRVRLMDIPRNHEDQIIAAGRRIREARRELDRALRSEQFDQRLIDQRIEEFAAAQAAQARINARLRAEMRQVLTPEQMIRLNDIEKRLRREMREQVEREQKETGSQEDNPPARRPPAGPLEFDIISLLFFPS
jgi:Spy/CpxP family protein refolding chaperone